MHTANIKKKTNAIVQLSVAATHFIQAVYVGMRVILNYHQSNVECGQQYIYTL